MGSFVVLPPEIVRQVLSGKRTMIRLPRQKKRAPYRENSVCTIKSEGPSCEVTITSCEPAIFEDQPVWIVRFRRGADQPRLLASKPSSTQFVTKGREHWKIVEGGSDYVSHASRALAGTAEEVSEALQARYAADSAERYGIVLQDRKKRLESVIREIRRHGKDPATNRKLREAERRIRQIPADVVYDLPSTG